MHHSLHDTDAHPQVAGNGRYSLTSAPESPDRPVDLTADSGRHNLLPCARARPNPGIHRWTIIARSTSAKTPRVFNLAFPAGVKVSRV